MIFDFHTHCFPDALAPHAIAHLAEISKKCNLYPTTDGTASGVIDQMHAHGVDKSLICNVATNAHQMPKVNAFACALAREQDELYALGSLHPQGQDLEGQIKMLKSAGIKGLKLHPDYIRVEFDDPILHPIFELCVSHGMFLITHTGYDPNSPDHMHCRPAQIKTVMDNFPDLVLIAAHMGGIGCEQDVLDLLCGKQVYFDTSHAGSFAYRQPMLHKILDKHDPALILYGSDCPWSEQENEQNFVLNAPITEQYKEDIFWNNAIRLMQ